MKCEYCGTETYGSFKAGRGERLLKVPCCKACYDALIAPLSSNQKKTMSEAAHLLVWQNERCDFEVTA